MFFWRWLRIVLDKFLNVWELSLDILEVALYILKVAVDILGMAVDILEVALDILEIALDILEMALDILEIALALWQTKRPTPLLISTCQEVNMCYEWAIFCWIGFVFIFAPPMTRIYGWKNVTTFPFCLGIWMCSLGWAWLDDLLCMHINGIITIMVWSGVIYLIHHFKCNYCTMIALNTVKWLLCAYFLVLPWFKSLRRKQISGSCFPCANCSAKFTGA